MSFLLRIMFSGLIALVPSADHQEVTVLLLNVPHSYHTSDGAELAHHQPLLLARAGDCVGDCPTDDSDVAQFVFADLGASAARDALQTALAGGGAWALSGSELSIHKGSSTDPALPTLTLQTGVRGTVNGQPQTLPTSSGEREDYSWIANLKEICPTCTFNTDMTTATVPPGLVAARLRLRTGKVFTYAVSRVGSNVAPVYFQQLDGQGSISSYSQAVANWVGADIAIGGDSVEIVEEKFNGDPGRSMKLSPGSNGKVEIAVLNLPSFVPPATTSSVAPEVGKHAELYYELATNAPASEYRLVPRSGAASGVAPYSDVSWLSVHPTTAVQSDLLSAIRLDIGRGPYEKILCPPLSVGP